jgi:hypothetical protein
MTPGRGSHNSSCANAKGRECHCSGCGGSQHGWEGWLTLATATKGVRESRREAVDSEWKKNFNHRKPRSNARNRVAGVDSGRLDIVDWLDRQENETRSPARSGGAIDNTSVMVPTPQDVASVNLAPGNSEIVQGPGSSFESDFRAGEPGHESSPAAAVDQLAVLAKSATESVWKDISAELGRVSGDSRQVKYQLADHGWCDLFVGIARVVEKFNKALDKIPEAGKGLVTRAILDSSMQKNRAYLTKTVLDVVVNKVWAGLKAAAITQVPLFSILTSEEVARHLRILAVFICPAPEHHKEVRDHALKPLGRDAQNILTEQTKARLAQVFGL